MGPHGRQVCICRVDEKHQCKRQISHNAQFDICSLHVEDPQADRPRNYTKGNENHWARNGATLNPAGNHTEYESEDYQDRQILVHLPLQREVLIF
jgi:hypothetical protein